MDIEKYWDAMKELDFFTRIWEQDGETLPIDKRLGLGHAAGLIKSDILQTHPGKAKTGVKTGDLWTLHPCVLHRGPSHVRGW